MSIRIVYEKPKPAATFAEVPLKDAEAASLLLNGYYRPEPTMETLLQVFEAYGGRDVFVKVKSGTPMGELRRVFLTRGDLPADIYTDLMLNGQHSIAKRERGAFADHPEALKNYDIFRLAWEGDAESVLLWFNGMARETVGAQWSTVLEDLPMVHDDKCGKPGERTDHYWCERPRVFHPDRSLALMLRAQRITLGAMDPAILAHIQEEVLSKPARTRAQYADSVFVKAAHWELLARDSARDVLNTLVRNELLPTEVGMLIMQEHKTPLLRQSMARLSADPAFLRAIWESSKAKSIRSVVEENIFFVKP